MDKFALEERLIRFGVAIIGLSTHMIDGRAATHLSGQLIRSGTAPALNYAEAHDAESKKDFIHKLKITLKELRETFVALRMIDQANLCREGRSLESAIKENNELIAIFVSTLKTIKR